MIRVKNLEKFENRFPNYGELILKILMRKPEDAKFIVDKLLIYLKNNPDVLILSIRNITGEHGDLRFMLEIEFICGSCKRLTVEESNLISFWKFKHSQMCEGCYEAMQDHAAENAAEYEADYHGKLLEAWEEDK